jgi:hypothetical protein
MRPNVQTAQLAWPNFVTKVQLMDSLRCPREGLVAPQTVIPNTGDNYGRTLRLSWTARGSRRRVYEQD